MGYRFIGIDKRGYRCEVSIFLDDPTGKMFIAFFYHARFTGHAFFDPSSHKISSCRHNTYKSDIEMALSIFTPDMLNHIINAMINSKSIDYIRNYKGFENITIKEAE